MAGVEKEAIETFISITGASESVALQKLEVHHGDLNAAVNAYYSEENRTNSVVSSRHGIHDDIVDIEDPMDVDAEMSLPPQSTMTRRPNTASAFDSITDEDFPDNRNFTFVTESAPWVSHPREVREVPIHFKDEAIQSSNYLPIIEDVTGLQQHGTELPGTVVIDDNEEEVAVLAPCRDEGKSIEYKYKTPGTSEHRNNNFSHLNDEIEEQMIRAAIEASKLETGGHLGHQFDVSDDHVEDAPDEWGMHQDHGTFSFSGGNLKEEGITTGVNGRQRSLRLNRLVATVFSSDEEADVDEEPLLRRRSQHFPNRTGHSTSQVESLTSNPVSHPEQQDPILQQNGGLFQSDEWVGISSEEHDEAIMLEAAMFGGVPERPAYNFGYPSQSSSGPYPRFLRSPSPTLTAQRLLRKQQDDEYLAALQADQERELKAMQESELQRLEQLAAHESAVNEENLKKKKGEKVTGKRGFFYLIANVAKSLYNWQELERQLSAKQASLPPEPASDDDNAVTFLIRMPNGDRCGRRFLKSDKLQCLFNFIDTGRLVASGTYRLVRPYPRRAFGGAENGMTLNELGLISKQEALFLELI